MSDWKNKRLTQQLLSDIDQYIKSHYEEPEKELFLIENCAPQMEEEQRITFDADEIKSVDDSFRSEVRSLDEVIGEIGESFHEMLFRFIDTSGMTDVEVYKKANLDRKLFSKIRSNPAYHPRKTTILALAISLKLSLDETKDLLCRAEYALSPGNKGDLVVQYFIEHGIYDVMLINEALDEYNLPILW